MFIAWRQKKHVISPLHKRIKGHAKSGADKKTLGCSDMSTGDVQESHTRKPKTTWWHTLICLREGTLQNVQLKYIPHNILYICSALLLILYSILFLLFLTLSQTCANPDTLLNIKSQAAHPAGISFPLLFSLAPISSLSKDKHVTEISILNVDLDTICPF